MFLPPLFVWSYLIKGLLHYPTSMLPFLPNVVPDLTKEKPNNTNTNTNTNINIQPEFVPETDTELINHFHILFGMDIEIQEEVDF